MRRTGGQGRLAVWESISNSDPKEKERTAVAESSATKNILMGTILVVALGVTVYMWTGSSAEEAIPDTPESTTTWVCTKCGAWVDLTAKGLEEARTKAAMTRDEGSGGALTSRRTTTLVCPKCNAKAMVLGYKCPKCGKGHLGDYVECDACRKKDNISKKESGGKKPTPRRRP